MSSRNTILKNITTGSYIVGKDRYKGTPIAVDMIYTEIEDRQEATPFTEEEATEIIARYAEIENILLPEVWIIETWSQQVKSKDDLPF